jgi:hypothetical protein
MAVRSRAVPANLFHSNSHEPSWRFVRNPHSIRGEPQTSPLSTGFWPQLRQDSLAAAHIRRRCRQRCRQIRLLPLGLEPAGKMLTS